MSIFYRKREKYGEVIEEINPLPVFVATVISFILLVIIWLSVMPKYRIYRQDLQGQANLRQQEWEKKIMIETAKATNESATLQAEAKIKQETANAQAEVIRAEGISKANEIIAGSLKGNESYLRYLWIDKVADSQNVIYVPTEAGLPILEAGKRK